MFRKHLQHLFLLCSAPLSASSLAQPFDFTVGAGYPYFAQAEVAYSQKNSASKWYANYRTGLDDGVSIGFETAISQDNKHALGLVLGALGARDAESVCGNDSSSTCQVVEPLLDLFDDETTNGLGASYSYYFNGINSTGWSLRLVAGYGESSESDVSRADGSLSISYQF